MITSRGRQRSQRARKAVLLGVGIFIALQLLLLVAVETRQPGYADPEYGYHLERLRTLRKQHPQHPSLVMLGSSRINNGYDTDYATGQSLADDDTRLPTVVSFALTGGTSVWQYLVLKRLIYQGIKPDAVVVEILPASLLADKQYFMKTFHFEAYRLRWSDTQTLATLMPEHAPRHRWEWFYNSALFPWHAHRSTLLGMYAPQWQVEANTPNSVPQWWSRNLRPTGWIPFGILEPTPQQRREAEAISKRDYAPLMSILEVSQEAETTYRAIFQCCRENNIQVSAVLLMPESAMYRSWYSEKAEQNIANFAASITQEFGIPVVDARTWIADDDQFWDGHHLLQPGAREFTTRMHAQLTQRKPIEPPAEPQGVLAMPPQTPLR